MHERVNSRNNLSEIKDGTYLINLDEYQSIGTNWMLVIVKKSLYKTVRKLILT